MNPNVTLRKVPCIKGIRALTGLGLREAKHISDELTEHNKKQTIRIDNLIQQVDFDYHSELINDNGMSITSYIPNDPIRNEIREQVNGIISYATLAGQYDLSKALLSILESHFPIEEIIENKRIKDNEDDD